MDDATMAALTDPIMQQGYCKAGFLGFAKGGKTLTGALLAVAIRRQFKIDSPIAMFDTEGGSLYIAGTVAKLTGKTMHAKRARSFDDMMKWGNACLQAGIKIGLVDSITHPWRELCDSYLLQKQDFYRSKNWRNVPKKLEFQDWNTIKPKWAQWTEFYLNAPMHIIICGRAGWEYEMEMNQETNKKELVKTGIKMSTEKEFGFEPSLLVEMERDQELGDTHKIIRRAIVLGDRFSVIDGKTAEFPSTDNMEAALAVVHNFFKPHLDCLTPGAHAPISEGKSAFDVTGDDDSGWSYEKRQRTIFSEEIQAEMTKQWPGQAAAEKQVKLAVLQKFWNTMSWTKIESMDSAQLKRGLDDLRKHIAELNAPKTETQAETGTSTDTPTTPATEEPAQAAAPETPPPPSTNGTASEHTSTDIPKPKRKPREQIIDQWQQFAQEATIENFNSGLHEISELPKATKAHVWSVVQAEMEIRGYQFQTATKSFVPKEATPAVTG